MNTSVAEAVLSQPEDPLLGEIEEPLDSPRCGECRLQGHCPCSVNKIIGRKAVEHRERILPILERAAAAGGKKSVRAHAKMYDTHALESILGEAERDVRILELASCVNKQHELGIEHGVRSVLHDRRSEERHRERRASEPEPVSDARIPEQDIIPSFLHEAPVPVPEQSAWQKIWRILS